MKIVLCELRIQIMGGSHVVVLFGGSVDGHGRSDDDDVRAIHREA